MYVGSKQTTVPMLIRMKENVTQCDSAAHRCVLNSFGMIVEFYGTGAIFIDNTKNIEYHHIYPLNQFLPCRNRVLSCVKTSSTFPSAICLHHVGEHVSSK